MTYYIVTGSDRRFSCLAELLLKEGENVTLWDSAPYPPYPEKSRIRLILPFSLPHEEIVWLVKRLPEGSEIFAGLLPAAAVKIVSEKSLIYRNILDDDAYCRANSLPTAEGALAIAIAETKTTVSGSGVLILGYGRVSYAVARLFSAVGARVTIAARKVSACLCAEEEGYRTLSLPFTEPGALRCFSCIINTVPKEGIISEETMKLFSPDAVIIELASGRKNIFPAPLPRVIYAPSLPGRFSPVSAAETLFQAIHRKD